jgi:hypothetical protein
MFVTAELVNQTTSYRAEKLASRRGASSKLAKLLYSVHLPK